MLDRINVINLADQILIESMVIKNSVDKHEILRKISEYIYDRVIEIKEICSVDKYDIYFNGKVAIGKSTAICNLFNLIDKDRLETGNKLSDAMLLKTASGRTTVCETVILQTGDNESRIVIEPTHLDDFKVLITEYCKMVFPNEGKVDNILSEEIKRFIENMLSVPSSIVRYEEKFEFFKEKLNLSERIGQNVTIDMFVDAVLEELKYESRNKVEYSCNLSNFHHWLKETYEDINDGRINECPLPERIIIHINKNDLDMKIPPFINRVIDTRGIDGGERKDIQDIITDLNSISIMCDEIGGYGENPALLNILKQTLITENKDLNFRVFLTGIEKGNQLEKANNANGNRSSGKKQKIGEATNKLKGINFYPDNFNFYNSFFGIDYSDKEKIYEVDLSQYEKEKQDFFQSIELGLKTMYSKYIKELGEHLENIRFLSKNSITQEALQKLEQCKDAVYEAKIKVEEETYDFINNFKSEIMVVHPSVLRGSVNRWGKYYNFNLYEMTQKLGGEEFKQRCFEIKTRMSGKIEGIFRNCDEIELICKQCLEAKIDLEYDRYYKKNRESYFKITEAELYNSESWEKPLTYWGDGSGHYKFRVTQDLSEALQKKNVESTLTKLENPKQFYNEILTFLEF